MEGAPQLPGNKKPESKKASMIVRAAAFLGMATAVASPVKQAQTPVTPETKRVEITRMARPEDIEEAALKDKVVRFTTREAQAPKQAQEGKSDLT